MYGRSFLSLLGLPFSNLSVQHTKTYNVRANAVIYFLLESRICATHQNYYVSGSTDRYVRIGVENLSDGSTAAN